MPCLLQTCRIRTRRRKWGPAPAPSIPRWKPSRSLTLQYSMQLAWLALVSTPERWQMDLLRVPPELELMQTT